MSARQTSRSCRHSRRGGANSTSFERLEPRYALTGVENLAVLSPNFDITAGALSFVGRPLIANAVTVSMTGDTYTITDAAEPIVLTAAAIAAGWTGDDTNTVSGPASGIAHLTIDTADGDDTVTLNGVEHNLVILGGGQAGDTLSIAGPLSSSGGAFFADGFVDIDQAAAGFMNYGAAGLIELNAANSVTLRANLTAGSTSISPGAAVNALTIADDVTITGGLTLAGSRNVFIDAGHSLSVAGLNANNLTLAAGTSLDPTLLTVRPNDPISDLVVIDGVLTLGNDSRLDVTDNDLLLRYDSPFNPIASIQSYINNFYSEAAGVPVIASQSIIDSGGATIIVAVDNAVTKFGDAQGTPFHGLTLGDSSGPSGFQQVIVRYALPGDFNLDNVVDQADYAVLDANLGSVGSLGSAAWLRGDGDFDGQITALDYALVDTNLGRVGQLSGGEILFGQAAVEQASDTLIKLAGTDENMIAFQDSAVFFAVAAEASATTARRAQASAASESLTREAIFTDWQK